ncbi:MAG: tetratricopeptide repeat protein [Planctomycetota bacterium]|nr:tetratricopeptide repeat protein [Planctomycetota bacterium]
MLTRSLFACSAVLLVAASATYAQPLRRSSFIEDQAAKKLLEAGDARYESDEVKKSIEIWQSVIERYPRSKFRFQAHMRLGNYFLQRDRSYDRARVQFKECTSDENSDENSRAEATMKMGICFYEARNYGKCFQVMRDVIEKFPVSKHVNNAYYYIGLGHFQLQHYSRSISALEKVGTALAEGDGAVEKLEAGKRLFVKVEDADLSALETGRAVLVKCEATSGDYEIVKCYPLGRNVRVVLGNCPTKLGKPNPNNGILEVKGDDKVNVTYTDEHTADKNFDRPVLMSVTVVGNAIAAVMDGAFAEKLEGAVLGKLVNVQINDADQDRTDGADKIKAVAQVFRLKTEEELNDERLKIQAERAAKDDAAQKAGAVKPAAKPGEIELNDEGEIEVDPYKLIDQLEIELTEVKISEKFSSFSDGLKESSSPVPAIPAGTAPKTPGTGDATEPATPKADAEKTNAAKPGLDNPAGPAATATPVEAVPAEAVPAKEDDSIHSGVFRTSLTLVKAEEVVANDAILQALPRDKIRITYVDQKNRGDDVRDVIAEAKCLEGNLGGVRVTRAVITDEQLRIQTKLKTASALTNIGNRYKEFGLKKNASAKYAQALQVCEGVMNDARKLGGRMLEETYVQLWKIYFQMDNLNLAAAMCQRLQNEFPKSGFVDDAFLQLADVARSHGDTQRAIGIYSRLVGMQTSQLRGEAQFGIASCYELMADAATEAQATQLRDRAFQEFKKVYDNFPDSGRVGEAVAKMANYYYQQKDYVRAVDTFESVLNEYPDAKFLDVILFNYGRCLYRMDRKPQARARFDQLIADFPESPLSQDAKKISDALAKAGF